MTVNKITYNLEGITESTTASHSNGLIWRTAGLIDKKISGILNVSNQWIRPPILKTIRCVFKKKTWLIYVDLAGPEQKMAVPPLSPRHKFHNYAHKTLQKVIQIDKSNNKAHTLTIKIANNSDISLAFCLSCGSVVLALMASRVNLHKRLEALARCYVTSHW